MCVVSYLPKAGGGYVLTSNRDEKPQRGQSLPPRRFRMAKRNLYYPMDPLKGGTWIVTNDKGRSLCLLNGGLQAHQPEPPYRISRGQMILELCILDELAEASELYNFDGIEPFTLVVIEAGSQANRLESWSWNGEKLLKQKHDQSSPHLWCSSTLYNPRIQQQKNAVFNEWLRTTSEKESEEIVDFHLILNRNEPQKSIRRFPGNEVETLSITSISENHETKCIRYIDLKQEHEYRLRII